MPISIQSVAKCAKTSRQPDFDNEKFTRSPYIAAYHGRKEHQGWKMLEVLEGYT